MRTARIGAFTAIACLALLGSVSGAAAGTLASTDAAGKKPYDGVIVFSNGPIEFSHPEGPKLKCEALTGKSDVDPDGSLDEGDFSEVEFSKCKWFWSGSWLSATVNAYELAAWQGAFTGDEILGDTVEINELKITTIFFTTGCIFGGKGGYVSLPWNDPIGMDLGAASFGVGFDFNLPKVAGDEACPEAIWPSSTAAVPISTSAWEQFWVHEN